MAKKKENSEFLNPFVEGVNYNDLLLSIGEKTIEEYCDGSELTTEQIEWLKNDLEIFKNK